MLGLEQLSYQESGVSSSYVPRVNFLATRRKGEWFRNLRNEEVAAIASFVFQAWRLLCEKHFIVAIYGKESIMIRVRWWSILMFAGFLSVIQSGTLWAQANLENPAPVSFQSGIGVISGWICQASKVEIVFDNQLTLQAAYGTSRADTTVLCGDANNGFSLLFNWNLLGAGTHTVRALADGVQFANATIVVNSYGSEFLTGGSRAVCRIPHVPVFSLDTYVQWQQSLQNFAIVDIRPHEPQFQGPECE